MIKEEPVSQDHKRDSVSAVIGQNEIVNLRTIWGVVLELDDGGNNIEE